MVEDDFENALAAYKEAATHDGTNAKVYLGLATCFISLERYEDALANANLAIQFAVESGANAGLMYLRKGAALVKLRRFAEAAAALANAPQDNAQAVKLIQICVENGVKIGSGEVVQSAVVQPVVVPPVLPSASLASKIRDSFYQNATSMSITIFAKNVTEQQTSVEFQPQQLKVSIVMPDSSTYTKTWDLYAPINCEGSRFVVTAYKVDITLLKSTPGDWPAIERASQSAAIVARENVHDGSVARYPPSSSKKKVDWNEVEQAVKKEEAEEKPGGEAALQALFQQIYGSGSDETKRAMMKSYQTSGGTVLSTNWKEVEGADYEKTKKAPAGQEFRSWKTPNGAP